MSALQRPVQFLEVSTLQRPELHLDVSGLQRNVLLLEMSTLQGPELHLDVSALQRSVLLLEVSPQGLSYIWTCQHYRGMCCSWRCLPQRPEMNLDVSALQRHASNPQGPVHRRYKN